MPKQGHICEEAPEREKGAVYVSPAPLAALILRKRVQSRLYHGGLLPLAGGVKNKRGADAPRVQQVCCGRALARAAQR